MLRQKYTCILSDIRVLDRVPTIEQSTLYTLRSWSVVKHDSYQRCHKLHSACISITVMATTRPMSNSSTSGKSHRRDIQWEHELCIHKRTRQRTTTVFYQLFILSIHSPCYNCVSYPNVHALSSYLLVIYLMSYLSQIRYSLIVILELR